MQQTAARKLCVATQGESRDPQPRALTTVAMSGALAPGSAAGLSYTAPTCHDPRRSSTSSLRKAPRDPA